MRIIGGKYKGRIFRPDKKFSARPTTDLAKEALFNILTNRYDLKGIKVLDLFAGTGSIGYEFASRGAAGVTFVEKNISHIKFIKKVIHNLKIENSTIFHEDVFRFLKKCKFKYDIIFCDPPFDLPRLDEIPEAVFKSETLGASGLLIIEHSKSHNFENNPNFRELRNYGKVNFSFFVNNLIQNPV
jgi:16S rRNA (guanine966-N2)-methyltransferase